MKRFISLFISITLFAMLLSSCSGRSTGNDVETDASQTTDPASTAIQTDDPISEWPRTHIDASGIEVVIEKQPENVVVLHRGYMEWVLSLGIKPTASVATEVIGNWVTLESLKNEGVVDLGNTGEPNMEKMIELSPDLIIAIGGKDDGNMEAFNKIAPAVTIPYNPGGYWGDELRIYASVLGKENEAEQIITQVETQRKAVVEKLSALEETVVFIQSLRGRGNNTVGAKEFFYDQEFGLGLNVPNKLPQGNEVMSIEGFAELNPDHIFIMADDEEAFNAAVTELEKSSVWNSLGAVKNNRVHYMNLALYSTGPISIPMAIDAVTQALLNGE